MVGIRKGVPGAGDSQVAHYKESKRVHGNRRTQDFG